MRWRRAADIGCRGAVVRNVAALPAETFRRLFVVPPRRRRCTWGRTPDRSKEKGCARAREGRCGRWERARRGVGRGGSLGRRRPLFVRRAAGAPALHGLLGGSGVLAEPLALVSRPDLDARRKGLKDYC